MHPPKNSIPDYINELIINTRLGCFYNEHLHRSCSTSCVTKPGRSIRAHEIACSSRKGIKIGRSCGQAQRSAALQSVHTDLEGDENILEKVASGCASLLNGKKGIEKDRMVNANDCYSLERLIFRYAEEELALPLIKNEDLEMCILTAVKVLRYILYEIESADYGNHSPFPYMNDKFAIAPGKKQYGQLNLLLPFYKPERIYHLEKLAFAVEKDTALACFLSDIFYIEAFYYVLLKKENIQGIENKKSQIHVRISQLEDKFAPPNIDVLPKEYKLKYARAFNFPSILEQISRHVLDGKTKFMLRTGDKQLALSVAKAFANKMGQPLVYGDIDRAFNCCALFDRSIGFGGDYGSIRFKAGLVQQQDWEPIEPTLIR